MADLVISIRVKETVSREAKDWPKKRIAVEGIYTNKLQKGVNFDFLGYCFGCSHCV